jgi:rubrerythrin
MSLIARLQDARRREKEQTLFYRALAAVAEGAGDVALVEALNELHADEQHHLSRLTARLLELGAELEPLPVTLAAALPDLGAWAPVAREREQAEVDRYRDVLASEALDPHTRELVVEILESERNHRDHLSGKWMSA